ncbi:MAG: hypothetical protein ABIE74_01135 [Pseudomonadota bacterium]
MTKVNTVDKLGERIRGDAGKKSLAKRTPVNSASKEQECFSDLGRQ